MCSKVLNGHIILTDTSITTILAPEMTYTPKIVGFGFHPIKDGISSPFIGLQTVSLFQNILRIEFGDILGYCRDAEAGLAGDVGNDELPFLKNGVQNDVSYKTTQIAVVGCGCKRR